VVVTVLATGAPPPANAAVVGGMSLSATGATGAATYVTSSYGTSVAQALWFSLTATVTGGTSTFDVGDDCNTSGNGRSLANGTWTIKLSALITTTCGVFIRRTAGAGTFTINAGCFGYGLNAESPYATANVQVSGNSYSANDCQGLVVGQPAQPTAGPNATTTPPPAYGGGSAAGGGGSGGAFGSNCGIATVSPAGGETGRCEWHSQSYFNHTLDTIAWGASYYCASCSGGPRHNLIEFLCAPGIDCSGTHGIAYTPGFITIPAGSHSVEFEAYFYFRIDSNIEVGVTCKAAIQVWLKSAAGTVQTFYEPIYSASYPGDQLCHSGSGDRDKVLRLSTDTYGGFTPTQVAWALVAENASVGSVHRAPRVDDEYAGSSPFFRVSFKTATEAAVGSCFPGSGPSCPFLGPPAPGTTLTDGNGNPICGPISGVCNSAGGGSNKPFIQAGFVPTCISPGSPIDLIGWVAYIACVVGELPQIVANAVIGGINYLIDLVFPGPALGLAFSTFYLDIINRVPFSYVAGAVSGVTAFLASPAGADPSFSVTFPSIYGVGGGTFTIPSFASAMPSGIRAALGGLVYFAGALVILRRVRGGLGQSPNAD